MPGRKPKPTKLKIVAGTNRKDRANPNEPKAAPIATLDPPAHLDPVAAEVWRETAAKLDASDVLTTTDARALEALCVAWSDLQKARELVAEHGEFYTTYSENGPMHRAHPAVAMRNDADRRFRSWAAEFGMTPSSRSKVSTRPPKEGDDPLKAYGLG